MSARPGKRRNPIPWLLLLIVILIAAIWLVYTYLIASPIPLPSTLRIIPSPLTH